MMLLNLLLIRIPSDRSTRQLKGRIPGIIGWARSTQNSRDDKLTSWLYQIGKTFTSQLFHEALNGLSSSRTGFVSYRFVLYLCRYMDRQLQTSSIRSSEDFLLKGRACSRAPMMRLCFQLVSETVKSSKLEPVRSITINQD